MLTGVQNGCVWSGCTSFTGAICATDYTGGSGRPIRKSDKRCGFLNHGRADFCCDGDCKYQTGENCGLECADLGMKSYGEVGPISCLYSVPGRRKPIPSLAYFCCP